MTPRCGRAIVLAWRVDIYVAAGYPREDAASLARIQSQDGKRWVDAMMVQELGLLREERGPLLVGVATLGAFVSAGSVPLLAYLAGLSAPIDPQVAFPVSLVLSAAALFGLGAAKVLVAGRNWLRSGVEMLVVGGLAAGVAYLVGFLLQGLGG